MTLVYVDQGSTGDRPKAAATEHGIDLLVVELSDIERGIALLPRR